MRCSFLLRSACAVLGTGALLATGTGTASGAEPMPAACDGALTFKDAKTDQNHLQVPEAERTGGTELFGGFLLHDPAKGAAATTLNIVTKELKAQVPSGWTTIAWFGNYQFKDTTYFLRAILDFTGATTFEYGQFHPNPAGLVLTGASVYGGKTAGALHEGKDGIVSIVVPQEIGGATGSSLSSIYAQSGQGRTLPTAFPGYSRGLTQILDTAPDSGAEANIKYTAAPCAVAPPAGGPVVDPGVPAPPSVDPSDPGTGTPDRSAEGGPAVLPVRLAASSVKAPKGKALALKLKSSENLSGIAARLRKGSKAVGTGSLAKLPSSGTLKLKLSRKLKKGSYALDLVGNLANGQRGAVTLKLKLR